MLTQDFSRLVSLHMFFFFSFSISGIGASDTGKWAISPYSDREEITLEKVKKQREIALTSMVVNYQTDGTKENISEVGIAYVKNGRTIGQIKRELNGVTKDGSPIVISFSDIKEVSVIRTESIGPKIRALLKVWIFPDISPEQLVKERPTYSKLIEMYTAHERLWVEITNVNTGALSFVGKTWDRDKRVWIEAPPRRLQDFNARSRIEFLYSSLSPDDREGGKWKGNGQGLWWAIPSVFRDAAYPYRRRAVAS
ncbi:MAG: hypothetical protein V7641_1431 [Blastocatellia bacterium]